MSSPMRIGVVGGGGWLGSAIVGTSWRVTTVGVSLSHRLGAWLAARLADSPERTEIPATPIRPFPLHRFRAPILDLGMQWNRLLDLVGR
ncbi:hypothetical protein [Mesorhizobium sp. L-8-3]|uniref:hypothetical protein n=1 Tax=Mesorhizobium sp. L-8-3 TaxID=2744522 RepID=UPI001928C3AD|nr:hypothetical protein [Mesorhizobium sp. L-8-3]BCH22919.1 hypothetical protein MesoLjLb_27040 [Mesorhizobium sp. L-8-3]